MKLESQTELNEETLKTFIADKASDISEAKNQALSKLRKKLKKLKKQKQTTDGQQETNAATEVENGNGTSNAAPVISQAVVFLTKCTNEQLMSSALFGKKAFSEENCNSDSPTKRAISHFASNEKIQSAITLFREQYPSWKKCKKQLMPKLEQNNNSEVKLESSIEAEVETNINGSPKKRKMDEQDNAATGQVKKRKKKKGKKGGAENSTPEKNIGGNFNMNKVGGGAMQNGISPKKKKLNAIEKALASGKAAMQNGTEEESDSQISSPSKNFKMGHSDPSESVQIGGASGHIVFSDNPEEDETNEESTTSSNANGAQRNWFKKPEFGRGNRRGNSRNGFSSRGRNDKFKVRKPFLPRDSANAIFVSSEWKKLVESPKTDEEKPSLLRPLWLTNPEEYKAPENGDDFKKNFRGGGRGRGRGHFRGRGRGRGRR